MRNFWNCYDISMKFWISLNASEYGILIKMFTKILLELTKIFWKHTRFRVYFAELNIMIGKILRKFHANAEEIEFEHLEHYFIPKNFTKISKEPWKSVTNGTSK